MAPCIPSLHMALACQPSTKWPRLAQQQRIFRAMALEQRTAKSCRLQGVLVADTGSSILAPWAECEVCTLVLEANEAATVQHMFRLVAALDAFASTGEGALVRVVSSGSELDAKLQVGRLTQFIHHGFAAEDVAPFESNFA